MPSENIAFTTRVEPISPPQSRRLSRFVVLVGSRRKLVEAPGTAPGSATLISQAVYRHSRLPDNGDIGRQVARGNPAACRLRARRTEMRLTPEQQDEITGQRGETLPTRRATVPALEEI